MKSRLGVTLSALTLLLFASIIYPTIAQQTGTITAFAPDPKNPNTLWVSGTGFNASEPVSLSLYAQDGTMIYSFPSAITDADGNFATNITLPAVSTTGIYTIEATTSSVFGSQFYVLFSPGDSGSGSSGSFGRSIKTTPDNSNIFNITGIGFNAGNAVTLTLTRVDKTTAYTFPDQIVTDGAGRFTAIVIVPTYLSGTFNLVASTIGAGANATKQITVPNLAGPMGATGSTGAAGPKGDTGATGASGASGSGTDQTLSYISVILSVVALLVAVGTFVKNGKHVKLNA